MNYENLAQCLWDWGGITLSLGIIGLVINYNCKEQDKIESFETEMRDT